jgi:hypothetical protein
LRLLKTSRFLHILLLSFEKYDLVLRCLVNDSNGACHVGLCQATSAVNILEKLNENMQYRRPHFYLSLIAICVIQIGCGGADRPPLGYVSGIVSMDGDPVANIIVVMKPESGRAAMVKTDTNGFYNIEYTRGEKGTKIGPTTVSLDWPMGEAASFSIPKEYLGDTSELKLDVMKGKQTFDIELTSDDGEKSGAKSAGAPLNPGGPINKAPGAGQPVD